MSEVYGKVTPFADPNWYHTLYSPYYNDSHRKLRNFCREYVDTYIAPNWEKWEKEERIPDDAMKRHADLGFVAVAFYPPPAQFLQGTKLPAGIPLSEWDAFHDFIVIDEMARCGSLGVVWSLICGNLVGMGPLLLFGGDALKQSILPQVIKGTKRLCLAITEPGAGSDVANISTTAQKTPDGKYYIVNGSKKWITNGVFSDWATTCVRTGGPGQKGISGLIVPLDSPGVKRWKIYNSGVSCSGSTYIEFDNVKVPVENLIGKENEGFKIFMSNFNHERLWLGGTALRLSRVCVEDAYDYANRRETFGKKLIEHPIIRAKFSDMGRRIETTQAFFEQIIYHWSKVDKARADQDLAGPLALAKVDAGACLEFVVRECQQILGGIGYARGGRGGRIEQASRDVRVLVVGGGSAEILSNLAIGQFIKQANIKSKM